MPVRLPKLVITKLLGYSQGDGFLFWVCNWRTV